MLKEMCPQNGQAGAGWEVEGMQGLLPSLPLVGHQGEVLAPIHTRKKKIPLKALRAMTE